MASPYPASRDMSLWPAPSMVTRRAAPPQAATSFRVEALGMIASADPMSTSSGIRMDGARAMESNRWRRIRRTGRKG